MIDFDEFHQYNQTYGHVAGDEVLQSMALFIQAYVPEGSHVARYGGEEFAVLLPGCHIDEAENLANTIRVAAHDLPCPGDNNEVPTVSIGCSEFGTHTKEAEGLVIAAELAVSQAKQLGRDRVCLFDSVAGADAMADPGQLHRFLKDGSLQTIQALAGAVDAKDPYTNGHSTRVAEYARDLAKYVGLPSAEVELIYTTGTLHDVGKIGVPDAILKKPARLDPDEVTIMQTHPVLGEVIIRKAPQLANTLPGVRHHHEAWDGSGYPDKLAGEAIPLMARVLAVADTFDAMTSDRPYRKGLSWDIALSEITKGAGTQFDPDLAPPFVAMMRARMPVVEEVGLAKAA
jgi:diguanylate cyclase (GGDEF)-like protein